MIKNSVSNLIDRYDLLYFNNWFSGIERGKCAYLSIVSSSSRNRFHVRRTA